MQRPHPARREPFAAAGIGLTNMMAEAMLPANMSRPLRIECREAACRFMGRAFTGRFILACAVLLALFLPIRTEAAPVEHKPSFEPFVWKSEAPADCPFPRSTEITGILFTGVHRRWEFGDTWYPAWAADGNLYSPFTDGPCNEDFSNSNGYEYSEDSPMGVFNAKMRKATTGQAMLAGDDPLNLTARSLGTAAADPYPYGGRYPCGSLVYHGVWYYGTYCLGPAPAQGSARPITIGPGSAPSLAFASRAILARVGRRPRARRTNPSSVKPACGATRSRSVRPISWISART